MESLYEPWARTKDSSLKAYIKAYVNMQYNALVDFATSGTTGYCSADWRGPPAAGVVLDRTVAAVSLTGVTVAMNNGTVAAASPATPTSDDHKSHTNNSIAVPLGVGVGAGTLILLGLLGGVLLYRCRRRENLPSSELVGREKPNVSLQTPLLHPIPFTLPSSSPSESVQPKNVRTTVPAPAPAPAIEFSGNTHFTAASNGKETTLAWLPEDQGPQINAIGSGSSVGHNRADDLPTSELVRVLNDRVNREDEAQGDSPPVYREHPQ